MGKIYKQLSDGKSMSLSESEWISCHSHLQSPRRRPRLLRGSAYAAGPLSISASVAGLLNGFSYVTGLLSAPSYAVGLLNGSAFIAALLSTPAYAVGLRSGSDYGVSLLCGFVYAASLLNGFSYVASLLSASSYFASLLSAFVCLLNGSLYVTGPQSCPSQLSGPQFIL
ncbi:unnamed protein product [Lota lota]